MIADLRCPFFFYKGLFEGIMGKHDIYIPEGNNRYMNISGHINFGAKHSVKLIELMSTNFNLDLHYFCVNMIKNIISYSPVLP